MKKRLNSTIANLLNTSTHVGNTIVPCISFTLSKSRKPPHIIKHNVTNQSDKSNVKLLMTRKGKR